MAGRVPKLCAQRIQRLHKNKQKNRHLTAEKPSVLLQIYKQMHTPIHTHKHTHMHTRTYTHKYIHTHMNTPTHTLILFLSSYVAF